MFEAHELADVLHDCPEIAEAIAEAAHAAP